VCRFLILHSSLKASCCHINFVGTHTCLRCPLSNGISFGNNCATISSSLSSRQWPQIITYIISDLVPLHCKWYVLEMDTKDLCNVPHRKSWPCTNNNWNNNMFWIQFGTKMNLFNFFQRSIHALHNFFLCNGKSYR
jgi:hypothetical protein